VSKRVREIIIFENIDQVSEHTPLTSAPALLHYCTATTNKNKFAVLSTLNAHPEKGAIASRTIQPFEVEYEEDRPVIFFNTNRLTR
jgi:hypothetical protein